MTHAVVAPAHTGFDYPLAPTIVGRSMLGGNGTTELSVPLTANLADNQLALACYAKKNTGGDLSGPAGWTELAEGSISAGLSIRMAIYWKLITNAAGEPATWDFSSSAETTQDSACVVSTWENAVAVNAVSAVLNGGAGRYGSTGQDITVTKSPSVVVSWFGISQGWLWGTPYLHDVGMIHFNPTSETAALQVTGGYRTQGGIGLSEAVSVNWINCRNDSQHATAQVALTAY